MVVPCPHVVSKLRFAEDLGGALTEGRSRCEAAGETWTAPRQRTYELLVSASRPMKAYEILSHFRPEGVATQPPTVYRSLDFLIALGLVHKLETISAYAPCRRQGAPHDVAFLICNCCGRADEIGAERLASAAVGYQIDSVRLEMSGRCPDCQPARARSDEERRLT